MGNTRLRRYCKSACRSYAGKRQNALFRCKPHSPKGSEFANKYKIEKVYDSIDEVFEDENVDIIYISTPHNTHIEYLRKALKNGKNVICEKSITLNSKELDEAINLAKENNVVLAEAMTIYHMPIYKKLNEIISSGKLGELRLIQMNFGSYKPYDMNNRFFNRNLAGGAMLDIGVYAISFVRWFMTSKRIKSLRRLNTRLRVLMKLSEFCCKTKKMKWQALSFHFTQSNLKEVQ